MSCLLFLASLLLTSPAPAEETNWRVCFHSDAECTDLFVSVLAYAEHQVLVQANSFSSLPILTALKMAHARGVDVQVVVNRAPADESKAGPEYDVADVLHHAGIPVWVQIKAPSTHNEVVVIDGANVIIGGFSFTVAAQNQNPENLLMISDSDLAEMYRDNWLRQRAEATPYTGLQ